MAQNNPNPQGPWKVISSFVMLGLILSTQISQCVSCAHVCIHVHYRSRFTTRRTSRESVWSLPPPARTSWNPARTTSAPSRWSVERKSWVVHVSDSHSLVRVPLVVSGLSLSWDVKESLTWIEDTVLECSLLLCYSQFKLLRSSIVPYHFLKNIYILKYNTLQFSCIKLLCFLVLKPQALYILDCILILAIVVVLGAQNAFWDGTCQKFENQWCETYTCTVTEYWNNSDQTVLIPYSGQRHLFSRIDEDTWFVMNKWNFSAQLSKSGYILHNISQCTQNCATHWLVCAQLTVRASLSVILRLTEHHTVNLSSQLSFEWPRLLMLYKMHKWMEG